MEKRYMSKIQKVENTCGGKGHVIIEHILGEKELNCKVDYMQR